MSKHINTFISYIIKGVVIGFLYFEITKENDTTFENMTLFTFFYIVMTYGAIITGIEANVVTSAFLTKTIFTLVDTRVKAATKESLNVKDDTKYIVSEIIEDELLD